MKFTIHIIIYYLFLITLLPSVRAIKMQFSINSKECSFKGTDCEMGKLVANLNFSSVQIIKTMKLELKEFITLFYSQKQNQFFYILRLKSPLENSIWRPPKNAL